MKYMKYLFLGVLFLLASSFASTAQKSGSRFNTHQDAGIVEAPPRAAANKKSADTLVFRAAQKQAVSGFNITEFVAKNFQYPPAVFDDSNFVSVRMTVEFIVEKDAGISGVKIIRVDNKARTQLLPHTERLLKQEVMRVMRTMPRWQSPAYQNGEAVRSFFTLPVLLRIE